MKIMWIQGAQEKIRMKPSSLNHAFFPRDSRGGREHQTTQSLMRETMLPLLV